jgi:hypothetical protein
MAADAASDVPELQRLPQYRLRSLFLLIACLAVLFAVMGTIGPIASAGLLFLLTMIGLHVAGNALGTTLRDHSSSQIHRQSPPPAEFGLSATLGAWKTFTPRLSEHTRLVWVIRAVSLAGALAGGVLGYTVFGQMGPVSAAGLAIGAISFAVLGAFFGFLIGSFLEMLLSAWRQALDAKPFEVRKITVAGSPMHSIYADVPPALIADIDAG